MDGEDSNEKPFVSSIDKVKINVKNLVIVAVVIAGIYYFVKNKT
jgi:hypothetical protein